MSPTPPADAGRPPIPGVDSDGCLIVLCQGEACRRCGTAPERSDGALWSLLREALGRAIRRTPQSVLITADCVGGCTHQPGRVLVAAQSRNGRAPSMPASWFAVGSPADAAIVCGAIVGHVPAAN